MHIKLNKILSLFVVIYIGIFIVMLVYNIYSGRTIKEITFLGGASIKFDPAEEKIEQIIHLSEFESVQLFDNKFLLQVNKIVYDTLYSGEIYVDIFFRNIVTKQGSYSNDALGIGDSISEKLDKRWYNIRLLKVNLNEKKATFLFSATESKPTS